MEPVISGEDPTELGPLLYELGVAAESGRSRDTAALKSAFDLVNQVEARRQPSPSFDGIALLDTAAGADGCAGSQRRRGAAAGLEGLAKNCAVVGRRVPVPISSDDLQAGHPADVRETFRCPDHEQVVNTWRHQCVQR